MSSIRIVTVIGARPQFVKAAAISRAIASHNVGNPPTTIDEQIIHTGQHYDDNMSKVFFDELQIPAPQVNLGVGSGGHGKQTGAMLAAIERFLLDRRCDCVLLYGDTNSTLAGALAAAKLHIPIAHVEAGLRSFNRRMPEEINRVVTDCLARLLFCPTELAVKNLAAEGVLHGVYCVGDVMFDSLLFHSAMAAGRSRILATLALEPKSYLLATIHRAENTDDPARLSGILDALRRIDMPIVLPLHPRTRKTLGAGLAAAMGKVRVIEPAAYLDMLMLERNARLVLTDSGGVQKEAYWCGVPCVTFREETEWRELVDAGFNRLVGADTAAILAAAEHFLSQPDDVQFQRPRDIYGDGHTAERIVSVLAGLP